MAASGSQRRGKVVVALSGGVDSCYAAWLLKDRGYEVEGICLDLYEGGEAPAEATKAGNLLGISVRVMGKREAFGKEVVEYFRCAYHAGLTPNPCAVCNPTVKFAALREAAKEVGADYIATGHYARCIQDRDSGLFGLYQGRDIKKDQSYFLYRLSQEALRQLIFPLGDMTKEEVRAGAEKAGLPTASKKDSQEICFIPDGNRIGFLRQLASGTDRGFVPGDFVDAAGKVLGRHKGLACYTIGQRKNLGASFGARMFVLALRPEENQVVVGSEDALYTRDVYTGSNYFISGAAPVRPVSVTAKLRSGAPPAPAVFYPSVEGEGKLVFDMAVRAAAPGQSAVYYIGDRVLGGGIIMKQHSGGAGEGLFGDIRLPGE